MDDIAQNMLAEGIGPEQRADRGQMALEAYPHSETGSTEEHVADLIADLLHLLDHGGALSTEEVEEVAEKALHTWRSERPDGPYCNHDEVAWIDGVCECGTRVEFDHDARPDDDNEPGDRCKDCGADIVWIGPSHTNYLHVTDARNA